MWADTVAKIDRLRELDRRCAIFGAKSHRYHQNPPATHADIHRTEERLGVSLPDELRSLYQTVGDGDVGPDLGMTRLDDIDGYSPSLPLQSTEVLFELAKNAGKEYFDLHVESIDNFELDPEMLHGLVVITQQGCGHRYCMVTAGDEIGQLVDLSGDGKLRRQLPTNGADPAIGPLQNLWTHWLDTALERLELVQRLIDGPATAREINDAHKARFGRLDNGQLFASLTDVEYPKGSWNKAHAWYEEALASYRAELASS